MQAHTTSILVADDEVSVAEGLSELLADSYRVLAPVTELAFVPTALRLTQVNILLLDLMFGAELALDSLDCMRAASPATRIIALTGRADPVTQRLALEAGVDGFILKSANRAEICEGIERSLRGEVPVIRTTAATGAFRMRDEVLHAGDSESKGDLVLWLLASGFTQLEVAERLSMSAKGVQHHVKRFRDELGLGESHSHVDWPRAMTELLAKWRKRTT